MRYGKTCVGTFGAADAKISISRNTIERGEFAFFMEPATEHAEVEFSSRLPSIWRSSTIASAWRGFRSAPSIYAS